MNNKSRQYRSNSQEHIKVNKTHNESIRTFNDIKYHLELEGECFEADKLSNHDYMAESSSRKALGFEHKKGHKYNQKVERFYLNQKKPNAKKHPRDKRVGKKKDKSEMKCYNYNKLGHFAREYIEQKKIRPNSTLLNYALFTSSILLTDSHPMWTVDLRATYHISRD